MGKYRHMERVICLYIGKHLSYNDVLRQISVSISSRILFLCVINEIIMKAKLNKI